MSASQIVTEAFADLLNKYPFLGVIGALDCRQDLQVLTNFLTGLDQGFDVFWEA